ncbi:uncharacterized protein LOC113549530 [Rhopalosiphum maidis]|uniref:uncharacterized protein LOC113549530 n=1 Tax=Rhopalosiphum maidis TaxID=43146 RepID=UPI000EFFF972|nr:uncharacterized protein LOC113549530 [Rhopalosiphum maidis]
MYMKSVAAIMLAYIHLYHCTTVDNSRINVKPTVDRVREVIQSVSGVGGQSITAESNSGHENPVVKPAGSSTTVPQSELLITTAEPVTTGSEPNQPSETYEQNTCSCLCSISDICQG